jgi:hypothetical protein
MNKKSTELESRENTIIRMTEAIWPTEGEIDLDTGAEAMMPWPSGRDKGSP